jgi:hypothetical protein
MKIDHQECVCLPIGAISSELLDFQSSPVHVVVVAPLLHVSTESLRPFVLRLLYCRALQAATTSLLVLRTLLVVVVFAGFGLCTASVCNSAESW